MDNARHTTIAFQRPWKRRGRSLPHFPHPSTAVVVYVNVGARCLRVVFDAHRDRSLHQSRVASWPHSHHIRPATWPSVILFELPLYLPPSMGLRQSCTVGMGRSSAAVSFAAIATGAFEIGFFPFFPCLNIHVAATLQWRSKGGSMRDISREWRTRVRFRPSPAQPSRPCPRRS